MSRKIFRGLSLGSALLRMANLQGQALPPANPVRRPCWQAKAPAQPLPHAVTSLCQLGTEASRVTFLTLLASVILAGMEPAIYLPVKRHLFSIIIPVVVTSCWMPLQGATLER